jgi:hypothetical protein
MRKSNALLFIVLLVTAMLCSGRFAQAQSTEILSSTWAPTKGTVEVLPDRQHATIILNWNQHVPAIPLNSLEIENLFPDWKRGLVGRYYPNNRLHSTHAVGLPDECQYKDIAFADACEDQTQGILLESQCLAVHTPGKVRIEMSFEQIPDDVTASRLLASRSQLAKHAKVIAGGLGCKALCVYCRLEFCPLPQDWLNDMCAECEPALSNAPGWNYFGQDWLWCAEPVATAGTTTFVGCSDQPFKVGCSDAIHTDAPSKICAPAARRCGVSGKVEACASNGLAWEGLITCPCGCDNGKCSDPCMSFPATCAGVPMPRITWIPKAPLVGFKASAAASAAATSDALHVFGAKVPGDHYAYYPTLGTWIPKKSPTGPITWVTPVANSSSGLYAFIPDPFYYIERYDAVGDSWATISGCVGLKQGPVNMMVDPNKPGGLEFWMLQNNTLYSYDPYRDLCQLFAAPVNIGDTAAFIAGGAYIFGSGGLSTGAYRYDVGRKVWNTISSISPTHLNGSVALVLGGLIGLFGGLSDTISFYDYLTDTWCTGPTKLPVFTGIIFIQSIGGKLYLVDNTGGLWEGTVY